MIALFSLALLAVLLIALPGRRRETCFAALMFSLCIYPIQLSSFSTTRYAGIAQSHWEIAIYTVVIAISLVFLGRDRVTSRVGWAFLPFAVYVAVWTTLIWQRDDFVVSGIVQMALAVGAWIIGVRLRDFVGSRAYATALVTVGSLQLGVSILQRMGFNVFSMDATTTALMGERVNGTFNHPNNLGKALFLVAMLAVPLVRSADRVVVRCAYGALGTSFIAILMTGGRAVIVASAILAIGVVFLQIFFSSKNERIVGLAAPIVFILASLPFIEVVSRRFQEDSAGGERPHLQSVAENYISTNWFAGTGPNRYVEVVGQYDSVTASGYPVHNSFLLVASEFGVIGCCLFLLPILIVIVLAWRGRHGVGRRRMHSLVLMAALPGLYVIFGSGWGILGGSLLPLCTLTLGIFAGQLVRSKRFEGTGSQQASEADDHLSRTVT